MKRFSRKIYLVALIFSMIAITLLVGGFLFYMMVGRVGLVPLIAFSISATILAVSGIVLLCFDLKSKS